MRVSDGARNLGHHSHTFARVLPERRCRGAKAPARCIFHAEKRQAFLTFADLVNWKDVWMIEAGYRFGFAPKAHECVARIHLMREDALHRDDSTRVLLPRAI